MKKTTLIATIVFLVLFLVVFVDSRTMRNGYENIVDFLNAELRVGNIVVKGPIQFGPCILENETIKEGSICYNRTSQQHCFFNRTGVTCI